MSEFFTGQTAFIGKWPDKSTLENFGLNKLLRMSWRPRKGAELELERY